MAAVTPSCLRRRAGFHCIGLTQRATKTLSAGWEGRALPDFHRKGQIGLVVQPQAELNGARLVALSVDGAKTRRTVEGVGIAEIGAVEDISKLSFKP